MRKCGCQKIEGSALGLVPPSSFNFSARRMPPSGRARGPAELPVEFFDLVVLHSVDDCVGGGELVGVRGSIATTPEGGVKGIHTGGACGVASPDVLAPKENTEHVRCNNDQPHTPPSPSSLRPWHRWGGGADTLQRQEVLLEGGVGLHQLLDPHAVGVHTDLGHTAAGGRVGEGGSGPPNQPSCGPRPRASLRASSPPPPRHPVAVRWSSFLCLGVGLKIPGDGASVPKRTDAVVGRNRQRKEITVSGLPFPAVAP